MKPNTALSPPCLVALCFQYLGCLAFDSSGVGDIHNEFTGIHRMDINPLASLASISLRLETSLKSSAAEGHGGRGGEGRKGGEEQGGEEGRMKDCFLTTRVFKILKKDEGKR